MTDLSAKPSGESRTKLGLLSVVVPVYCEQDVIAEFMRRLSAALGTLSVRSEIVFVNDGSHDGTLGMLIALASEHKNVSVVDLSRNFGKEIAMTAGLDHTSGDAVVMIDADLQDPPELIPEMVRVFLNTDCDVVYGQRRSRSGETWLKRATAHLFYRLMRRASRVSIPVDTGDFRIMSRRAVDALRRLREHHRFMKGLFAWIGFRQVALAYDRDPRFAGETKFNYWRLWNFSLEGVTSFTIAPLKFATYMGLLSALAALFYGTFIVVQTLLYGNPVAGYPSLLVLTLFLGGVQLTTLGIIGEYLGRVFNESKQRPLYFVQRRYGLGAGDDARP